jgi:hypothetical protein
MCKFLWRSLNPHPINCSIRYRNDPSEASLCRVAVSDSAQLLFVAKAFISLQEPALQEPSLQGCVMKRQSARARQSHPDQLHSPSAPVWDQLRSLPAPTPPPFQASSWVKLLNPPTAFSFDQAWLLCECENHQWLAWIPDYGSIVLSSGEFCAVA